MSAEIRSGDYLERTRISDAVLRRPDRSVDIAAYVAIARRERTLAILAVARAVVQFARQAWSTISARPVRSERPISGVGCVQTRR